MRGGIRDGVNATPKFYVDGERIDGKLPLEGLEDAIRAAARAASGDPPADVPWGLFDSDGVGG